MNKLVLLLAIVFMSCEPAYAQPAPSNLDPSTEAIIAKMQAAFDAQRAVLDAYMRQDVLKCGTGDLVVDQVATVDAEEVVYSYSGSDCRVQMLPEPGMGLGLALGVLGLALALRYRPPRARQQLT